MEKQVKIKVHHQKSRKNLGGWVANVVSSSESALKNLSSVGGDIAEVVSDIRFQIQQISGQNVRLEVVKSWW